MQELMKKLEYQLPTMYDVLLEGWDNLWCGDIAQILSVFPDKGEDLYSHNLDEYSCCLHTLLLNLNLPRGFVYAHLGCSTCSVRNLKDRQRRG